MLLVEFLAEGVLAHIRELGEEGFFVLFELEGSLLLLEGNVGLLEF